MTRTPSISETDANLTRLLDVERRLEERLRAAEVEATAQVEAARAALQRAAAEAEQLVEAEAARAEASARAEHQAALQVVEAGRTTARSRLAAVSGDELDRLARLVLAHLGDEVPP